MVNASIMLLYLGLQSPQKAFGDQIRVSTAWSLRGVLVRAYCNLLLVPHSHINVSILMAQHTQARCCSDLPQFLLLSWSLSLFLCTADHQARYLPLELQLSSPSFGTYDLPVSQLRPSASFMRS